MPSPHSKLQRACLQTIANVKATMPSNDVIAKDVLCLHSCVYYILDLLCSVASAQTINSRRSNGGSVWRQLLSGAILGVDGLPAEGRR